MSDRHFVQRPFFSGRVATLVAGTVMALSIAGPAAAQQRIVLPAVSGVVDGRNGSRWLTEILIVKANPEDHVVVRRLWVCTEQGGFEEDPEQGMVWALADAGRTGRALRLSGTELLAGSGSELGAVALSVEGGTVVAVARVVDVSRGAVRGGSIFGLGQLTAVEIPALVGPATIPWIGGDSRFGLGIEWRLYRNNVGFVNPNPEPLQISGVFTPFGPGDSGGVSELAIEGGEPEVIEVALPPFGWKQISWESGAYYGSLPWGFDLVPTAGFVVGLRPNSELPYYAYASVVFSPDPNTGDQELSDPLFIPAIPGFVGPIEYDFKR
jgi:hypothetical protein